MGAGSSVLQRSVLLLKKQLNASAGDDMPATEELAQIETAAIIDALEVLCKEHPVEEVLELHQNLRDLDGMEPFKKLKFFRTAIKEVSKRSEWYRKVSAVLKKCGHKCQTSHAIPLCKYQTNVFSSNLHC